MNLWTALQIALHALIIHKGRSALTSLGIIIGTGAVISMVSAAGGARQKLDERLDNVGKTLIVIRAGSRTQNGTLADTKPLTNDDAALLRRILKTRTTGLAEVQATIKPLSTRTRNCITMVVGTSPDMRKVRAWNVTEGRFITDEDLKKQAAVCVLGHTVHARRSPIVSTSSTRRKRRSTASCARSGASRKGWRTSTSPACRKWPRSPSS